jgi:hypothetical protein
MMEIGWAFVMIYVTYCMLQAEFASSILVGGCELVIFDV